MKPALRQNLQTSTGASGLVTIVAPMFNEENNVEPLVKAVETAMKPHDIDYELVLVDDGSADGTWRCIEEQASRNRWVKGISLSRNFGHQNALFAGLQSASGRAVVTLDGDLQHPPSLIPELVKAWRSGWQVVTTIREDAGAVGWFKRSSSRGFYRLFGKLTGFPLAAGTSDFRLLDRRVVNAMLEMRDPDLFLRGMVTWMGFRATAIRYRVVPRQSGKSKYTLHRMLRLSSGAVFSFSTLPLRVGIWVGFFTSFLAFLELVYILVAYWRGSTVPGWASVMTVMSFMFGMLFVLLGNVGLYIGKIYEVVKGRQRFIVGDTVGFPDREPEQEPDQEPAQENEKEREKERRTSLVAVADR